MFLFMSVCAFLHVAGFFAGSFLVGYILFPSACHRFVGYVEEEAVHSYTMLLDQIDAGTLPNFANAPCPDIGKRCVCVCVRASVLVLLQTCVCVRARVCVLHCIGFFCDVLH